MLQVRAVLLVVLLLVLGCSQPTPPTSPLRLGALLPESEEARLPMAADLALEAGPNTFAVELEAPRATTLEFVAQGSATRLEVNWRLAGEEKFYPRRMRGMVLQPGDEDRRYTLELQGHRAWGGRVEELQLRARGGRLRIVELTALVPPSPYRDVEIGRRLIPSLPGAERREFVLPQGLPPQVVFDVQLGVLPAARGEDVTVRFTAWVEKGAERTPWFEAEISSAGDFTSWRRIRQEVNAPQGGLLVLSSEVRQGAQSRSPGAAVWGRPQLLFPKIEEEPQVAGGEPYNLLVIAVDTLRADMLGSYGNDQGLTPHLDALARRGYRLADLSSPAPWTLPSFATLMTGLQPQTHEAGRRLVIEGKLHNDQISRLEPGHRTLAEILSEAGFRTAGFYTNVFLNPSFGLHRGFDEYQGFESLARAETVVDEALEWLEPVGEERFFLFVHLLDPHSPYRPPPEFCQEVAGRLVPRDSEPSTGDAEGGEAPCRAVRSVKESKIPRDQRPWAGALYRAEVAYADAQIGRLLAALEARSDGDRTVVVLMSDHGEELWEHEEQRLALGYHPLAGHGHSHYQELVHVPAILAVPGQEPREVFQGAETVDLFPTLLALLGLEPPPNQGRDLRPQLTGERISEPLRISDFQLYGTPRWSARRGPWKLVVMPGEDEVLELYNLEEDPEERENLAAEQPDLVAALRQGAEEEFVARAGQRLGRTVGETGQAAQLGEEELERLRALGYIQ